MGVLGLQSEVGECEVSLRNPPNYLWVTHDSRSRVLSNIGGGSVVVDDETIPGTEDGGPWGLFGGVPGVVGRVPESPLRLNFRETPV